MRLTEQSMKILSIERGQKTFFDDAVKGFGVRVSQGGTKTFVLMHGKDRKLTKIGNVGIITLQSARNKARDILAAKQLRLDPSVTMRFEDAISTFLAMHVKPNNKPSTAKETERLLSRHFYDLYPQRLAEVTTTDLTAITDRLLREGKPQEANHAYTAIKTALKFCVSRRYIQHSPLEGLKKPYKPTSRDRVLSDRELAIVLSVARSRGQYGQIIELLLLTGQRLNQIAQLRSEWIEDGEQIRFPAWVMKSGKEHVLPLTPGAKKVLGDRKGLYFATSKGRPFNNWGNSHNAFLAACNLPHFTRHDLRRTWTTLAAEKLDILPHIIEAVLQHQSGEVSGVSAIYNRAKYQQPMRHALLAVENYLSGLSSRYDDAFTKIAAD